MSLLWLVAARSSLSEEHAEHAMHPYFAAAGITEAPCGYSLCDDVDQEHSERFDEAESRLFAGQASRANLDLSVPLHGFEHHLSPETRHGTDAGRAEVHPPTVFRSGGQHYIMDGHNRLAAALLAGRSHHPVHLVDLDQKD